MGKKSSPSPLVLLLILLPTRLGAQDLWERGLEWFRASEGWKPREMTSVFLLRDGNGREEERVEEVYLLSYENGKPSSRLVSSLRNGTDQTEKRRKEEEKQSRHGEDGPAFRMGEGEHPLNPEFQSRVSKTATATTRIDGVECVEYSFDLKLEKSTMSGTIALAKPSGEPVRMSWTLDPLPPFLSELSFRSRYERASFGLAVLSSVEFSGSGGMLFIRKDFLGTMSMSSYGRD